jgi:hypothetical protein
MEPWEAPELPLGKSCRVRRDPTAPNGRNSLASRNAESDARLRLTPALGRFVLPPVTSATRLLLLRQGRLSARPRLR